MAYFDASYHVAVETIFCQSSADGSASVDAYDDLNFEQVQHYPADFWFKRQQRFRTFSPDPHRHYVSEILQTHLGKHKEIAVGDTVQLKRKDGFRDAEFLRIQKLRIDGQGILWLTGSLLVRAKYFPVGLPQLNEVVMLVYGTSKSSKDEELFTVSERDVDKPRHLIITSDGYPHHNPTEAQIENQKTKLGGTPTPFKGWAREAGTLVCRMVFEIRLVGEHAGLSPRGKDFIIRHVSKEADAGFDNGLGPDTHVPLDLARLNSRDTVTYVDGFAGAGGSLTGAKQAGVKVLSAFDENAVACQTLRANHPDIEVYHGCQSDVALGRSSLWYHIFVDILHLSCPCQYYARCKTRPGPKDGQNRALTFCVKQQLRYFTPLILTMEQTDNMLGQLEHQPDLFCLMSDIVSEGYNIRFKVADMREGGLPAERQRLITIASRRELPLPAFPTMPYGPPGSSKPQFRTPRQALSCFPPDPPPRPNQLRPYKPWNPDASGALGTMTTTGFNGTNKAHWGGYRQFSIGNLKVLQGFDKDYIVRGTATDQKRQIGNAVPPVYWKYIISHLKLHILRWKEGKMV